MDYQKFGRTDLEVSKLCLGCMTYGESGKGTHPWTLDEETSRALVANLKGNADVQAVLIFRRERLKIAS